MPSSSEAQRRKMAVLYKRHKISKASWEKYKVIRRTKKR